MAIEITDALFLLRLGMLMRAPKMSLFVEGLFLLVHISRNKIQLVEEPHDLTKRERNELLSKFETDFS